MNNYIFLDIDGVLNHTYMYWPVGPYDLPGIHPDHLNILKQIVEKTNSKLVLISDWRLSFLPGDHMPYMADYIKGKLNSVGLPLELASHVHKYEDRGIEIKNWINTHKTSGYVILDDDFYPSYYHPELIKHWVRIDSKVGLTDANTEEINQKINVPVVSFEITEEEMWECYETYYSRN